MSIRRREPDDLAGLAAIAQRVRATDSYPPYLPDDDLLGFLDSPDALGSWVALVGPLVVGQAALHASSSSEVMSLAAQRLGIEPERLGVVARLLVDPSARRAGVASSLLEHARVEAVDRGLVPILDVVERFAPAISLYEREGWTRLGTVTVTLPDGTTMNEHVYAGPSS